MFFMYMDVVETYLMIFKTRKRQVRDVGKFYRKISKKVTNTDGCTVSYSILCQALRD